MHEQGVRDVLVRPTMFSIHSTTRHRSSKTLPVIVVEEATFEAGKIFPNFGLDLSQQKRMSLPAKNSITYPIIRSCRWTVMFGTPPTSLDYPGLFDWEM